MLVLGRLLWPRLTARPPLPGHLASPLAALAAAVTVAKVAAIPLTVIVSAVEGVWWPPVVLVATAVALGLTSRRARHIGSGQLLEDALFLGLAATLLGWVGGNPTASLGIALVLTGTLATGGVALLWLTWGRAPKPVWMRQPTFRILGDNPATLTAIARIRVGGAGWVLSVRDIADGPVTVAVLTPAMRPVAHLGWSVLQPWLTSHRRVRVGLGTSDGDLPIPLSPGRYLLSVRFYRPRRQDAAPPLLTRIP